MMHPQLLKQFSEGNRPPGPQKLFSFPPLSSSIFSRSRAFSPEPHPHVPPSRHARMIILFLDLGSKPHRNIADLKRSSQRKALNYIPTQRMSSYVVSVNLGALLAVWDG